MDFKQYLARFHVHSTETSLKNLADIQRLHMQHVPFENLDVGEKIPIYLNVERFYEKIVTNKRGGYCYEVNGLLQAALSNLGFHAHLSGATVKRPNGKFAKENTHVTIIVELDQKYVVDVGFGNSNYEPIPMDGSEHEDVSGRYKIVDNKDGFYDLVRMIDTKWTTLYRFSTEKMELADFHEGIVFNQVSPGSTFTHHDIVTVATPTGRITLADHTLTTRENGVERKQDLTPSEKRDVLSNTFGIENEMNK